MKDNLKLRFYTESQFLGFKTQFYFFKHFTARKVYQPIYSTNLFLFFLSHVIIYILV